MNLQLLFIRAALLLAVLLVPACVSGSGFRTGPGTQTHVALLGNRDNDLVFVCGSAGMGVDFVTGNCVSSRGNQVNPYNLYPPFMAPLPRPSPSDTIMRCRGRAVDFVTSCCM